MAFCRGEFIVIQIQVNCGHVLKYKPTWVTDVSLFLSTIVTPKIAQVHKKDWDALIEQLLSSNIPVEME